MLKKENELGEKEISMPERDRHQTLFDLNIVVIFEYGVVTIENKKQKCYNQTAGKDDMEYGENIFL